jgi:hypothetical protein
MWLKNNSTKEWKDYNCGDGVIVTIKAKSTFEVDDKSGELLLKNLGHEKWLTVTDVGETKKDYEKPKVYNMPIEEEKIVGTDVSKEEEPKKKK